MAINRSEYFEHLYAMLKLSFRNDPESAKKLFPHMLAYVTSGNIGTIADRREALRIFINAIWTNVLNRNFDPHRIRHYLSEEVGIDYDLLENIPRINEP